MAEVVLATELGRPTGTRAVRRLRREGKVPGVIYGHGTAPLPVAVVARELRVALTGEAGVNQLLSLDTGSATYLTIAREMQRHPVAQTVTHVDFVIVRRDEVISADVPITLVGEATEVHHGDGLVEQQMFALTINALPSDIPSGLEADISALTIGGAIRVADLTLPAGVTSEVDPESTVAVGQPPRVVVEEAPEGEVEGEAEGGAEGEAAPGAEPSGEASGTASEEG
jgi:large subunit ribosomal protein L25